MRIIMKYVYQEEGKMQAYYTYIQHVIYPGSWRLTNQMAYQI